MVRLLLEKGLRVLFIMVARKGDAYCAMGAFRVPSDKHNYAQK